MVDALTEIGFEHPTPIQALSIPILLQGNKDLLATAQTGTGKTAAFGLPLVELLDENSDSQQALILSPTRELCLQITEDLVTYSKNVKNLNVTAVYGGASIQDQIRKIKKGAQIVVATPGRLIDLIQRKAIFLHTVKYVVLDEADEMLNMGFKEDIDQILACTPVVKNTWLFSATMPSEIRRIANAYMREPEEVGAGEKNQGNVNISHKFITVNSRDRYAVLKRVLDINPDIFGLIFCRTKIDTQEVAEKLMKDGYNADSLHGDLSQLQRDAVMRKFRERSLQILVATDVAARGIDVDNITHVIHLNLPDEMAYYTHRSGRTARAGKIGQSIALITKKDRNRIKEIERSLKTTFEEIDIPKGKEVCKAQLMSLIHKVHEVKLDTDAMDDLMPDIYEELKAFSKEEVIQRFASVEFNRFLDYYRNAPDLDPGSDRGASFNGDAQRIFMNIGKMDGLEVPELLEILDEGCGLKKKSIGKIVIKGAYTFFEVAKTDLPAVMENLDGASYDRRKIRVELAGAADGGEKEDRWGGKKHKKKKHAKY